MFSGGVVARSARGSRRLLVLMLSLLATSCGGGGGVPSGPDDPDDPSPPDDSRYVQIACPGFQLAASQGRPLDEIPIGALPSGLGDPVAVSVSAGDDEHSSYTYILTEAFDEVSGLRLLVPLHPHNPLAGGPVRLTVTDNTRACAPVEFTIQPLPPAEGEFAAVLDLLQEVLTEQAAVLDATPADLLNEPIEALAPALVPLAMAQTVLDDPDNPESLRMLAQGGAPAEALVWLDRLLARTDVRASLESTIPGASSSSPSAPARVSGFACLPEAVSGAPPEILHMCMTAAAEAIAAATGPLGRKVSTDVQKAFSAAAAHPAFSAGAGAAGTALGALDWAVYSQRERAAALLPSRFVQFEVAVDKPRFLEDEDADGEISSAQVVAANLGYNLQQEIENGIEQATNLAKASGSFDFSTGTPADDVKDNLEGQVEERLKKPGNEGPSFEEFEIPVELFGPVQVADPDWIQVRVAAGDAVVVPEGTIMYEPRKAGTSTLRVRTHDSKFGGAQTFSSNEVTVAPIQIRITPSSTTVEPTDPSDIQFVEFDVDVIDSKYPDQIELQDPPHPEQGSASLSVAAGGSEHSIAYLAPDSPDYDKTDFLVVRHTATTGAREYAATEVTGTATIGFGSIEITPRTGCVELDGERTFQAAVEGPEDDTVTWTVDHGDIDDDGKYTAPPEAPPGGTATIKAVSVANPDLEDEVTIPVGCTCSSTLKVAGRTIESEPGDRIYFTDWGGPDDPYGNNFEFFAIVFRQANGDQTTAFPLEDDPATWPKVGGYNPVRAQGSVGTVGSEILYSSDDEFPAVLDLQEYVPEKKAIGTVSGGVTIISGSAPFSTPATLEWTFAVTLPPDVERGPPLPPTGYRFGCTVGGD